MLVQMFKCVELFCCLWLSQPTYCVRSVAHYVLLPVLKLPEHMAVGVGLKIGSSIDKHTLS